MSTKAKPHQTESIESLSFLGPRLRPEAGAALSERRYFLNVGCWLEAEKFRPFSRQIYDEICFTPSFKEARRLANKMKQHVRGDWLAVRNKALAVGLSYASQVDPNGSYWQGSASEIATLLEPFDLEPRQAQYAATEFVKLRSGKGIAFLGGARVGDDVVGRRVYHVNKSVGGYWSLIQWQGRHASWAVHDWAVSNLVPIVYMGIDGQSLGVREQGGLLTHAKDVCVFDLRSDRKMEPLVKKLRAKGFAVNVDWCDPERAGSLI